MESFVNGVGSSSKMDPLTSTIMISPPFQPLSLKQAECEGSSTRSAASAHAPGMKTACHPNGSVINLQSPVTVENNSIQREGLPNMAAHLYSPHTGKPKFMGSAEVLSKSEETPHLMVEPNSSIKHPMDDSNRCNSSSSLESESIITVSCESVVSQSLCPSPSISVYTAASYAEAGPSFTNTEAKDQASAVEKSGDCCEVSNSYDPESRTMSTCRGSTDSNASDESSSSTLSGVVHKPHKANDIRWEAIQSVRSRVGQPFGLNHFKLLRRLGCGDIGSVYLSELAGTGTCFAMKIMDKATLAARKKLLRAQTEREILQSLDHPFLPTLYSHFETEKFSCLVMEFCPGGDLHALRQRQHGKYFPEHAARFYVAEVLLALEYLHMLGIIFRDLKPENVLVREDGHIMLSDFDLSLRCAVCPTLVKSSNSSLESKNSSYCAQPACIEPTCVIQPDCIQPACFRPSFLPAGKRKKDKKTKTNNGTAHQIIPLPELIAEPTSARSMSFVGTHEYLAPEIIKGEGHGSAVDWWTLGVFLYELLFGKTPFKGQGNRATLFNVVGQPLRFPELPSVSFAARDLIKGLLVKEPQNRLAYRRGATEIKQHPFFQSINWALIRCANPPEVPKQAIVNYPMRAEAPKPPNLSGGDVKTTGNYYDIDFF